MASSRFGSVEPHRFQSVGPVGVEGQGQFPEENVQPEPGAGGGQEAAPPPAPKKSKKKDRVVQDTRTELRDDELMASRNNYLKEQGKLRIKVELRRQERDASRVVDIWMEGVPHGCKSWYPLCTYYADIGSYDKSTVLPWRTGSNSHSRHSSTRIRIGENMTRMMGLRRHVRIVAYRSFVSAGLSMHRSPSR